MEKTKIAYCDSTVNLTRNCVGCELWNPAIGIKKCYAGRMENRWRGDGAFDQPVEMLPGRIAKAAKWSDLTGTERPGKPWLNGMPRIIFVGDMSDTLSPAVEFDFLYTEQIQGVTSELGQRHLWLWLTKQAPRLARFDRYLADMGIEWPANLIPGVTITRNNTTRRIDHLLDVRSKLRWLSVEPLLEPVDLDLWSNRAWLDISWIVAGGESGPGAGHADPDWFRNLRDQAAEAKIPFFMKQGSADWQPDYREPESFPADLRIREMFKWF
jgi:protein gp37